VQLEVDVGLTADTGWDMAGDCEVWRPFKRFSEWVGVSCHSTQVNAPRFNLWLADRTIL